MAQPPFCDLGWRGRKPLGTCSGCEREFLVLLFAFSWLSKCHHDQDHYISMLNAKPRVNFFETGDIIWHMQYEANLHMLICIGLSVLKAWAFGFELNQFFFCFFPLQWFVLHRNKLKEQKTHAQDFHYAHIYVVSLVFLGSNVLQQAIPTCSHLPRQNSERWRWTHSGTSLMPGVLSRVHEGNGWENWLRVPLEWLPHSLSKFGACKKKQAGCRVEVPTAY